MVARSPKKLVIVIGAPWLPPFLISTSRWYTPARRQPVCPGFSELASFSTVRYGFPTLPELLLEPSDDATLSHTTLDLVTSMAPVECTASMPRATTTKAVAAKNLNDNARNSLPYPWRT